MKTVTDDFVHAQKQGSVNIRREVYYKRRYWDQSTETFVWESSWVRLGENEIRYISPITWNLDNVFLSQFKVSNLTITADNTRNQWNVNNNNGFFKKDSQSPNYKYEPYWMKFQVRIGYELTDGTEEKVTLFTGVATDYIMSSINGVVQIRIEGLESLLQNTRAEDIATVVDQENIGTGNDSDVDFTTSNPGVGGITLVSIDGITQTQGQNYTISQLNDSSLGGKVTFTIAPTAGQIIRATYYYWPLNQDFEDLVTALLDAAGIPTGDQEVQDVVFENDVLNSVVYDSQADFETGTLTDITTSLFPNYMLPDWEDTDLKESQTWSTSLSGWDITEQGGSTITTDGTNLVYTDGGGVFGGLAFFARDFDRQIGWFEFKYAFGTPGDPGGGGVQARRITFWLAEGKSSSGFTGTPGTTLSIELNRDDNEIIIGDNQFIEDTVSFTHDASEHTVKVILNGTETKLYVDGTLMSTIPFTIPDSYVLGFFISGKNGVYTIRDFVTPKENITVSWDGPTIDATTTPSAFGQFSHSEEIGNSGATINYYTRTSSDDISYESDTLIPATNIPESTLQRYIQVKAEIVFSTSNFRSKFLGTLHNNPEIDNFVIRFTTSSTAVTLPNFNGISTYDAIQKIGEFTGYEFGFKSDEKFFFRARVPGNSILSMTEKDYISEIKSLSTGLDRTYGYVRAVYGSASSEIFDDGSHPDSPTARTKQRRFTIQADTALEIPTTADISTGIAQAFFDFLSKNRRRVKFSTILLPQIELADVVTVSFMNNHPEALWYWGDNTIYWGKQNLHWWGNNQQIIKSITGKVISARYDTDRHVTDFEIEEVVQ